MPQPTQQSVILLASAARIATPTVGVGQDMPFLTNNQRFVGAHILLDVTADPSTAEVNIEIEGFDFGSETFYNILTGAAVNSVSFNIYKIHPDFVALANLVAKEGIPYLWRVRVVHVDVESLTYSLGVNYLN